MFQEWWYVLGKHVQQQPNCKHEKISTLFVELENKTQLKTNWNRKDSAHKQVKKKLKFNTYKKTQKDNKEF